MIIRQPASVRTARTRVTARPRTIKPLLVLGIALASIPPAVSAYSLVGAGSDWKVVIEDGELEHTGWGANVGQLPGNLSVNIRDGGRPVYSTNCINVNTGILVDVSLTDPSGINALKQVITDYINNTCRWSHIFQNPDKPGPLTTTFWLKTSPNTFEYSSKKNSPANPTPLSCKSTLSGVLAFDRVKVGSIPNPKSALVTVKCNKPAAVSYTVNGGGDLDDTGNSGSVIRFALGPQNPAGPCTSCSLPITGSFVRPPRVVGKYTWSVPVVITYN